MKPSQKLFELARKKAKETFKPNQSNNIQSIRLTADEKSYTLFYLMGAYFIGSFTNDPLPDFFSKRYTYEMYDKNSSKVEAKMQRLIM